MEGDCLCGHKESRHKWNSAECGVSGCGCNVYRVGRIAKLPKEKYVIVETDTHYEVYTREGDESFT